MLTQAGQPGDAARDIPFWYFRVAPTHCTLFTHVNPEGSRFSDGFLLACSYLGR